MLWLHLVEIKHCKESCVCHDCRNFKLCRSHFPKRSCMSWLSRPRFLSAGQLTQVCADLSESECYATNAPCSRATCYMLHVMCYLLDAICYKLYAPDHTLRSLHIWKYYLLIVWPIATNVMMVHDEGQGSRGRNGLNDREKWNFAWFSMGPCLFVCIGKNHSL